MLVNLRMKMHLSTSRPTSTQNGNLSKLSKMYFGKGRRFSIILKCRKSSTFMNAFHVKSFFLKIFNSLTTFTNKNCMRKIPPTQAFNPFSFQDKSQKRSSMNFAKQIVPLLYLSKSAFDGLHFLLNGTTAQICLFYLQQLDHFQYRCLVLLEFFINYIRRCFQYE